MSIKLKWITILFFMPLLAACGGNYVPPERCPYGGVLATAEKLPTADGVGALLYGATVLCEKADDSIKAEITVYGDMVSSAKNIDVTIFAALVDRGDNVLVRAQEEFSVRQGLFEVDMPVLQFDASNIGITGQAGFFIGFVLTGEELNANRAAWRENLNMD